MLGVLLTLMDNPITIQNPGVFVLGMSILTICLGASIAVTLISLRDAIEEVVADEIVDAWLTDPQVVAVRFEQVQKRVEAQMGGLALAI